MNRYYSRLRPVSIGTYPAGMILDTHNYDCKTFVEAAGCEVYGYIDYDRELEEAIAQKKDAEKHAADLAEEVKRLKADVKTTHDQKIELAKKLKTAEEKAEAKAKAEIEKGLKTAKAETERALEERAAAIDEKNALEEELAGLRSAAKMADPDVAGFKVLFERVQSDVAQLWTIITRIAERDQGTAEKLSRAMTALAGKIGGAE